LLGQRTTVYLAIGPTFLGNAILAVRTEEQCLTHSAAAADIAKLKRALPLEVKVKSKAIPVTGLGGL
jgi:hypothetical protein